MGIIFRIQEDGMNVPELFDRAAEALCDGHLGRGAQLLEQALEKESATYDTIPKMVLNKLHTRERSANNSPVALGYIAPGASCAATSGPADLKYADLILNVRDHVSSPPPLNVLKLVGVSKYRKRRRGRRRQSRWIVSLLFSITICSR